MHIAYECYKIEIDSQPVVANAKTNRISHGKSELFCSVAQLLFMTLTDI